jgi:hypothetical protein
MRCKLWMERDKDHPRQNFYDKTNFSFKISSLYYHLKNATLVKVLKPGIKI